MCCSLSSTLDRILTPAEIMELEDYLKSLSANASKSITASKIVNATHICSRQVITALTKCVAEGILDRSFGLRCPSCNMLIKRVLTLNEISENIIHCYSCDEVCEVTPNDVEVLYSLKTSDFFNEGQQVSIKGHIAPVALNDTLAVLLSEQKNFNSLLFSPTEQEYQKLEYMYNCTFSKTKNRKEQGDTLEDLIIYLFGLSDAFRTAGVRTCTNQIDCYVRNQMFLPYGVFNFIGSRFIIECKNECKTPSVTYIQKLHDIIATINGNSNIIRFGIFVSRRAAPKSYRKLSNKYHLMSQVIIICINSFELKELIQKRANLFEMIERKVDEVILDSSTDMKSAGLYQC